MSAAAGKRAPAAKRARKAAALDDDDVLLEEAVAAVAAETAAAAPIAVPETADPVDFEALDRLRQRFAGHADLRILPMPKGVHKALGLPVPGIAGLMEVAQNAFTKPLRETYTGSEVRDLRETHSDKDFPAFYTGPAFPHMLPEGGARVINHSLKEEKEEDDDGMGTTIVPPHTRGAPPLDSNMWGAGAGAARAYEAALEAGLIRGAGAGAGAGAF
jgi:hypothetical protein